jgi:hypothetical protein
MISNIQYAFYFFSCAYYNKTMTVNFAAHITFILLSRWNNSHLNFDDTELAYGGFQSK